MFALLHIHIANQSLAWWYIRK